MTVFRTVGPDANPDFLLAYPPARSLVLFLLLLSVSLPLVHSAVGFTYVLPASSVP